MEIAIGKPVLSSDGKQVGKVDSIVLDYDTKEVREILVQQGMLLTQDRIVDRPMVERIDEDGVVHLKVSADMVDQLPPFVEQRYAIEREGELRQLPHAWTPVGYDMPLFQWGGHAQVAAAKDYTVPPGQDELAFLREVPFDREPLEVKSDLREDTVVIHEGTEVVGSDGKALGSISDVVYDEDGQVTEFVVKAGFVFHHDIVIPASWIDSITSDTVQLTVSKDQAESADSA